MNITTKFNAAERAFMLHKGEVLDASIVCVVVVSTCEKVNGAIEVSASVHYDIDAKRKVHRGISENKLYKTKKEAVREMIRQTGYKISEDALIEI